MNILHTIVLILLIVGAINWGLVGLFSFDLVAAIFGRMSVFARLIYIIVGLAGVYAIIFYHAFYHPAHHAEHHDEHAGRPHMT
ncbi:MAG: DUF378 domain-containing protein [Phycisphaerae bacterium]|jgi:uncharacterized membrane protein YuzA (DUF378 family)|nr:DUF378 domain-containing protein [Phycisphaerae bacterium]